jgi:teichuronic acid biosynthesis glycosyltransferase TuaC
VNILFTPSNYPSRSAPFVHTFVQQYVRAMAWAGTECTVISPIRFAEILRHGETDPVVSYDTASAISPIKTVRPKFMSFSKRKVLGLHTGYLTYLSFRRSCIRALAHLERRPDAAFGHFLYPGGATAVYLGSQLGIPSFVRVGESGNWTFDFTTQGKAIRDFRAVTGMIANSTFIKEKIVKRLKVTEERVTVFPNGVNLEAFFPRNRLEMRDKFDFPKERYIITFVGQFDENKGPHRLLKATSGLEDIGVAFVGSGQIPLNSENIVFKGRLPHEQIPEILSASDIFVLPTLLEGSCNAVIEALACGLPVVTSNGGFNDDIMDDQVGFRVDPSNIREIRKAILALKEDKGLREKMSDAALRKAKQLDINMSAKKILQWVQTLSANFRPGSA